MAGDPRVDRLRASVLAAPPEAVRSAVRAIGEPTVRALPARARPLIAQLKRSSSPVELLRRLPDIQVVAVIADILSDDCLNAIRDELGDAADDPTKAQLVLAVDAVLDRFDVATVRVMLATVAVGDAEASEKCDEILTQDERFAVEAQPATSSAPTARAPKETDDVVKARRRERKEAEKARRAQQRERAAAPKAKKKGDAPKAAPADDPPAPIAAVGRRAPRDVPAGFTIDDPLVGTLVVADVLFDDGIGGKTRPAVVIAVGADEVLVRPGYSEGGMQSRTWQAHELRDWAAAGLTKPTWIEPDARTIPRADVGEPIGRLTDDDWNALL